MNEQNKLYNREEFLAGAEEALKPSMDFFAENVLAKLNKQERIQSEIEQELKPFMERAYDIARRMKKARLEREAQEEQNKDKE
jgi:hypothetical protein